MENIPHLALNPNIPLICFYLKKKLGEKICTKKCYPYASDRKGLNLLPDAVHDKMAIPMVTLVLKIKRYCLQSLLIINPSIPQGCQNNRHTATF